MAKAFAGDERERRKPAKVLTTECRALRGDETSVELDEPHESVWILLMSRLRGAGGEGGEESLFCAEGIEKAGRLVAASGEDRRQEFMTAS